MICVHAQYLKICAVCQAVEFSKSSPEPSLKEMWNDILVEPQDYIRGTDGIYGHGKVRSCVCVRGIVSSLLFDLCASLLVRGFA